MKVVDWISWADASDKSRGIDLSGGFFKRGMRWKDYESNFDAEVFSSKRIYFDAIRDEVIETGNRSSGRYHQYSEDGVPLFEDGSVATFSYRAWGDLMAAIWSEHENKDYSYMDFYC